MKNLVRLFIIITFCNFANAQLVLDWSQNAQGGGELIYGPKAMNNIIATDTSGNIYATGKILTNVSNLVDFDPGPGVFNLDVSVGNIYISKTDASGNFVWAKQIGGAGPAFPGAITLDATGNIYISVKIGFGAWDLNPSPTVNTQVLSYTSQRNIIEKLNNNGELIWIKSIDNEYSESYGQISDLNVDDAGNVYATGSYRLNSDFDPGAGVFNLSTISDTFVNNFALKLNSSGDFVWAKAFKRTAGYFQDNIISHTIKNDANGNVYISGYFTGTTDFDPGVGVLNKTSIGSRSLFVAKLNSNGDLVWVNTNEKNWNSQYGFESKMVLDAANNLLVFDTKLNSDGYKNSVVYKIDGTGGITLWSKSLTEVSVLIGVNGLYNTGYIDSNGMTIDAFGSIYLTGKFFNTVDFDPGIGVYTLSSYINPNLNNGFEAFIVKLDFDGNFIFANKLGGLGDDYISNILVSPSGKLIVKGFAGSGGINKSTTAITAGPFLASYTQPALASNQFENNSIGLKLYPNPTKENLNVQLQNSLENASLKIILLTGQTVFEKQNLSGANFTFDVADLSAGIYLIQILEGKNIFNSKFVKQ